MREGGHSQRHPEESRLTSLLNSVQCEEIGRREGNQEQWPRGQEAKKGPQQQMAELHREEQLGEGQPSQEDSAVQGLRAAGREPGSQC